MSTSCFVTDVARKTGSLLDAAQTYWMERFLQSPSDEQDRRVLEPEVYFWATAQGPWDGYPNLATCGWPG